MQLFDSLLKLFGRMTIYGLVLGIFAGMLVGAALAIVIFTTPPSNDIIESAMGGLMFGGIYGAIFGGIYGSIAGLFSGIVMTVVTGLGYRIVRNPKTYKYIMGAITAFCTGFVFFGFGLWDLGMEIDSNNITWLLAMLLSVGIAVYASQIAAGKYIIELSNRKEKEKAV